MEILKNPLDSFKDSLNNGIIVRCTNCDADLKLNIKDICVNQCESYDFRNELYNKTFTLAICPICNFNIDCDKALESATGLSTYKIHKYIEICNKKLNML